MTQMIRSFFGLLLLALIASCDTEQFAADAPIFLDIPAINLETDRSTEGTAHEDIDVVWLFVNGQAAGVYELPATIPLLLEEGENEFILFPGISANGVATTRVIYDPYRSITLTRQIDLAKRALDTLRPSVTELTTGYKEAAGLAILEDFDNPGLNFERLVPGDTTLQKAPEGSPQFSLPGEPPSRAGLLAVDEERSRARSATVLSYSFPRRVANVYVEITYRGDINLEVGIIALTNDGELQAPVAVVFPKEEWNKIYISFIDDVNAFAGIENFKFYLAARLPEGRSEGKVYVDNVKLLWTE